MTTIEKKWYANEFSGPAKLHNFLRKNHDDTSLRKIRNVLNLSKTFQLHKPNRKRFQRRKIIVNGPNEMVDMDLLDLRNIGGQNYSKKYLLTIIDVFSRKAYACALTSKRSENVLQCFKALLKTNPELKPRSIRTDHGKYIQKICCYINDNYLI